jgi:hypothetical protein
MGVTGFAMSQLFGRNHNAKRCGWGNMPRPALVFIKVNATAVNVGTFKQTTQKSHCIFINHE